MSPVTKSDVEAIIARIGSGCSKILSYKLEPFSKEKCGILGEYYSLSVEFEVQQDKNANNKVKLHKFFVKSLGDRNNLPSHLDVNVFEEEINFYRDIIPLMLENYNGEKWSPDCYLAKSDVLVLEDLRERGFNVPSEQTMNEKCLKLAAATLARFHACSVLAEDKMGKPLNEAFPTYFTEKICNDNNKFGQAVKLGYKTQVLMAEKLGLDASFVLPAVYNYVSRMVIAKKEDFNVVCHSDLYKYNFMFSAKDDALLLDYQLLRYASPLIDISILLHLNTTPEFRKASDTDILKHYYSVFRHILQQSKIRIHIPTYNDMLEKYHKCKIVGMATSVDYLASLCLDQDTRFQIWNDPNVLEKYIIRNRIDILGPKLETDVNYAKAMKDILCEYLDEAKRVLKL